MASVVIKFEPKLSVYKIAEIEPQEFRSLIERYCWVVAIRVVEKEGGRRESFDVKRSLTTDNARATLACDDYLDLLRRLDSLNTVRLPVRRKTGAIELLPRGYDSESRSFTIGEEEYFDTNWSLEQVESISHPLRRILFQFR